MATDMKDSNGLATFCNDQRGCDACGSLSVAYRCHRCREVYFCEECRFNEAALQKHGSPPVHQLIPLYETHRSFSRTFGDSTSLGSPKEGVSSVFYDPCSLCKRTIEDIEPVNRCDQCDFIVCSDCFAAQKVSHEHELRPFIRKDKSKSMQEITTLLNKSRRPDGNRIINDYAVVRLLGQGSYAKVKLVQHVHTGELFALKILRRQHRNSSNLLKRTKVYQNDDDLLREIAVMKYVDHPNIVKLIEVIEDMAANRLYMIMEYCSNGPVHELGNPPLSLETVRKYGCDILSGLTYMHSEFLYHRDVKPTNCLVTNNHVVKIVDFGNCNSRILSSIADGTLAYSCPEIIHGEVSGDIVDSWAFALTLYQMAFGTVPSEGMKPLAYRNFLLTDVPIPVPPTQKPADPLLCDLLEKMLNKNVKQRLLLEKAVAHPFFMLTEKKVSSFMHQNEGLTGGSASQLNNHPLTTSAGVSPRTQVGVAQYIEKALDEVRRGKNLPESFHGVKAMRQVRRGDLKIVDMEENDAESNRDLWTLHPQEGLDIGISATASSTTMLSHDRGLSIIQERVNKLKETQSRTLDIIGTCMHSAPVLINDSAPFITVLHFSGNSLSSTVSLRFSEFMKLKNITITSNKLIHFPEEVLDAPRLLHLDLSHNFITNIPETLRKAKFLEHLNLHSNCIAEVGLDTQTRQSVLHVPRLQHVRLSSNPLQSIPVGIEEMRGVELVLDANPTLSMQWSRIIETRDHTTAQPNPVIVIWDDYFPVRVPNTDPPIWIANSSLNHYRLQTLQMCKCKRAVLFVDADTRFPVGCKNGIELGHHFDEMQQNRLQAHHQRRNLVSNAGGNTTMVAPMQPQRVSTQLPFIVQEEARNYMEKYFFISSDEKDPAGGYCALSDYIDDSLQNHKSIMFFMMSSILSMQSAREITIAVLSECLSRLKGHDGALKEQFDTVMASMRSFY